MPAFKYEPLGCEIDAIRVVTVERSGDYISCLLESARLSELENKFIAVSHVWGKDDRMFKVLVNGQSFFVTPQLWQFLHLAAERVPGERLWLDAICINQQRVVEKERQIPLMGRIYSIAMRLIAWLPTPIDGWHRSPHRTDLNLSAAEVIVDEGCNLLEHLSISEDTAHALTRLLVHQYWSRVWIVQELRLSGKKEFWWEGQVIGSQRLERLATAFDFEFKEDTMNVSLFDHMSIREDETLPFTDTNEEADLVDTIIKYGTFKHAVRFDCVFAFLAIVKGGSQIQVQYDVLPIDLLSRVWHASSHSMNTQQCCTIGQALGIDWSEPIDMPWLCVPWRIELEEILQPLQEVSPEYLKQQIIEIRKCRPETVDSRVRTLSQQKVNRSMNQPQLNQYKKIRDKAIKTIAYDSYQHLVALIRRLDTGHQDGYVLSLPTLGMYYILWHREGDESDSVWLGEVLKISRTTRQEIQISHVFVSNHRSAVLDIIRSIVRHDMDTGAAWSNVNHVSCLGYFVGHSRTGEPWSSGMTGLTPTTFLSLLHMSDDGHPLWSKGRRWIIPVSQQEMDIM